VADNQAPDITVNLPTGEKIHFPAGTPEAEMQAAIASMGKGESSQGSNVASQKAPGVGSMLWNAAASMVPSVDTIKQKAGDVASGISNEIGSGLVGLSGYMHKIPGVSSAVDSLYGTPGLSQRANQVASQGMQDVHANENLTQKIGGLIANAGAFAVPVGEASALGARAGQAVTEMLPKGAGITAHLMARYLPRIMADAGAGAGVSAVQGGDAKSGAALGGVLGGASQATGDALKWAAPRAVAWGLRRTGPAIDEFPTVEQDIIRTGATPRKIGPIFDQKEAQLEDLLRGQDTKNALSAAPRGLPARPISVPTGEFTDPNMGSVIDASPSGAIPNLNQKHGYVQFGRQAPRDLTPDEAGYFMKGGISEGQSPPVRGWREQPARQRAQQPQFLGEGTRARPEPGFGGPGVLERAGDNPPLTPDQAVAARFKSGDPQADLNHVLDSIRSTQGVNTSDVAQRAIAYMNSMRRGTPFTKPEIEQIKTYVKDFLESDPGPVSHVTGLERKRFYMTDNPDMQDPLKSLWKQGLAFGFRDATTNGVEGAQGLLDQEKQLIGIRDAYKHAGIPNSTVMGDIPDGSVATKSAAKSRPPNLLNPINWATLGASTSPTVMSNVGIGMDRLGNNNYLSALVRALTMKQD